MTKPRTATETLNREFLEIRCRLLDIAAALDRIERAAGGDAVRDDTRLKQICEAVTVLVDGNPKRAERVQMVFSNSYDPRWR